MTSSISLNDSDLDLVFTSSESRQESASEQESGGKLKRRNRSHTLSRSSLPQNVSSWKRRHAEKKVGIVYAKNYSRGLEGLEQYINGKINEFTHDQKDYMEFIDKHITFSLTLSNFYIDYPYEDSRAEAEFGLIEAKIRGHDRTSSNWDFVLKIKNFIKCLRKFHRNIRYYKGSRKSLGIAEGLLTHLIGTFAELCYLDVEYCNQACQAELELYGTIVWSEPDLRLYKSGLECEASDTMVSVIEVKPGYGHNPDPVTGPPKKRSKGSPRSSDVEINSEMENVDAIALNIHDDILGRHAGQLLLDLHLKYRVKNAKDYEEDRKINMLGMIVEGSLVYLTVLEMTWKHYQKLKSNQTLDSDDKATIYYTSPQNFLMKPERSVLIRDFMRINNIDFF